MARKFKLKDQWSLIIFTLLIQFAVGSVVIVSIINSQLFNRNIYTFPHEISSRLLLLILVSIIIAVLSSFFHLGNPLNAHLSLNNLSSSWLSREILLVILFSTTILAYFIIDTMSLSNQNTRLTLGIIGSILGIALVVSMSKLYMIETVPAWNTFLTPSKFFTTSALLGITGFLLILIFSGHSGPTNDGNSYPFKLILQIVLLLILAELILFFIELWILNSGSLAEMVSYRLITEGNRLIFFANIFLFAASILVILFLLFLSDNRFSSLSLILISGMVILLQITQRYLFYASYNRIGI